MKVKLLFVFTVFLSFGVWANTTVYVLNDNSEIRSSKSAVNDQNILKIVNKDQSLQRLTMHYSGWSLVAVDDINGWILSSSLTSKAPVVKNVITSKVIAEVAQYKKELQDITLQLSEANQKLTEFKQSNTQLSNTVTTLKTSIDKLSFENSTLKQALEVKSKVAIDLVEVNENPKNSDESILKAVKSNKNTIDTTQPITDSDAEINSKVVQSDQNIDNTINSNNDIKDATVATANWIYIGIVTVIILLLILLAIYNSNKRRHFDLNTLRR